MKVFTNFLLILTLLVISFTAKSQVTTSPVVITGLTIDTQYFPNVVASSTASNSVHFSYNGQDELLTSISVYSSANYTIKVEAVGLFTTPGTSMNTAQLLYASTDLFANQTKIIELGKFNYFKGVQSAPYKLFIEVSNNDPLNPFATRTTYFIYNDARPLPVTLVSFNAKAMSSGNSLSWVTASEVNFDKFLVEYSQDGLTFYSVGEVKSKGGTSATGFSYTYFHIPTKAGNSYYRLKVVDRDGSFSYSPVQAIVTNSAKGVSQHLVKFGEHYFSYDIPAGDTPTKLTLMDMLGRVIVTQNTTDTLTYPSGEKQAYLLRLTTESGKSVSKLVE